MRDTLSTCHRLFIFYFVWPLKQLQYNSPDISHFPDGTSVECRKARRDEDARNIKERRTAIQRPIEYIHSLFAFRFFEEKKRYKMKIHRRDVIEDKCQLAFPSCPISFLLSALYCPNLPTAFLCTTATFCRASARPQHVVQVRCAIARRRDPLQQTKADRSKLRTPSPYDVK